MHFRHNMAVLHDKDSSSPLSGLLAWPLPRIRYGRFDGTLNSLASARLASLRLLSAVLLTLPKGSFAPAKLCHPFRATLGSLPRRFPETWLTAL